MNRLNHVTCGAVLACAALLAHAQSNDAKTSGTTPPQNVQLQQQEIAKGDPARWYQADASDADRARTLRKEIGAALAEAKLACGKQPQGERAACLQEARATHQRDMQNVSQLVVANQQLQGR